MNKIHVISLNYKIGDTFEDNLYSFYTRSINTKVKYRINEIEITVDKNEKICIHYKAEYFYDDYNLKHWRISDHRFTDEELKKLISPTPYNIIVDFNYSIGDIVWSGTNGIIPSNPETFEDPGPFPGRIWRIGKHIIHINFDNSISKRYVDDVVFCDNGNIYTEEDNKHHGCEYSEEYICSIDKLNIDKIVDNCCRYFSKKQWREDHYRLYNEDGSTNMSRYNPNQYENSFSAIFKYLGVEDKVIKLYLQYVDDRKEGRKLGSIKKTTKPKKARKKDELDDLISSLSEKDKEKLLKKLLKDNNIK